MPAFGPGADAKVKRVTIKKRFNSRKQPHLCEFENVEGKTALYVAATVLAVGAFARPDVPDSGRCLEHFAGAAGCEIPGFTAIVAVALLRAGTSHISIACPPPFVWFATAPG